MKKIKKKEFLSIIAISSICILSAIVLLCLNLYKEILFFLFPLPFALIIFFSFLFPRKVLGHGFKLFLSIFIRYLAIIISILVPTLIWYFIPNFKDVSAYYIFASFDIVLVTYIISIVCNLSKERGKNEEKKQG